ncbi:MAG TPA: holo-ACP synthase [Limnochordales bacterium]
MGLGVDVVEVDRIAAVLARYGQRFVRRVFSEQEAARCGQRRHGQQEACLAGRFAAKEAVMKALGTGTRGVAYREIEVASLPGGRPTVRLHGRAWARARQLGVESVAISITHGRDVAVAVAVALARAPGGPAAGAGDASGEGA